MKKRLNENPVATFNPGADVDEVMDFIQLNTEAFEKFKDQNANKVIQAHNEEQLFMVHRSTRTGLDNWQITTFENGKPIGHETRESWEQAIDIIEDDIDWTDPANYKVASKVNENLDLEGLVESFKSMKIKELIISRFVGRK